MSGSPVAATRRALEAAYGLALEGLTDRQLAAAQEAAGGAPAPGDRRWLERVLDRLPIDESWLFRDDELWEWLRDEAGPALLERAMARERPVRVLSIGCSSGQEAFSLAIAFQGVLVRAGIPPSAGPSYVSIVGVDPSPARVAAARSGVVNAWSVQRSRDGWLGDRVVLEDPASGRYRVDATVRAMCRFEVDDLGALAAAGRDALGGFDLVLCRHVLIYFRPATAERAAGALLRGLDPGALLVVAAAEAHLLGRASEAQPLGLLGACAAGARPPAAAPIAQRRVRGRSSPAAAPRRSSPASPRARPRRSPAARHPALPPPPQAAPDAGHGGNAEAVATRIRDAVEHAGAGRTGEALREARAALFLDSRDLVSRLLLGQQLMAVDPARGRGVLRAVLDAAERLPADAEVPAAEELSMGQLSAAARVLLSRSEEA